MNSHSNMLVNVPRETYINDSISIYIQNKYPIYPINRTKLRFRFDLNIDR